MAFNWGNLFSGIGNTLLGGTTGLGSALAKPWTSNNQQGSGLLGSMFGLGGKKTQAPSPLTSMMGNLTGSYKSPNVPKTGSLFNLPQLPSGIPSSGSLLNNRWMSISDESNLPQKKSFGDSLLSFFGGNKGSLFGAGLTALGGLMPMPNKVPQSTDSLDQLRALAQSGGGPMSQAAQSKVQEFLNQKLQPMTAEEEAAIRRQYDLERTSRVKNLQDMYTNAQPGVDYLTSTNYQRDLEQRLNEVANQENTALAQARRQVANDYYTQQMGAINAARGLDEQQLQLLSQITGLDINQLMQQLEIDRADQMYKKNLLTGIGTSLISPKSTLEKLQEQFYRLQNQQLANRVV